MKWYKRLWLWIKKQFSLLIVTILFLSSIIFGGVYVDNELLGGKVKCDKDVCIDLTPDKLDGYFKDLIWKGETLQTLPIGYYYNETEQKLYFNITDKKVKGHDVKIEDKNKLKISIKDKEIFNVISTSEMHQVGDFKETAEWAYFEAGVDMITSNYNLEILGRHICAYNVTNHGIPAPNCESKLLYPEPAVMNKVNDTLITVTFPDNYDPVIDSTLNSVLNGRRFMKHPDGFYLFTITNLGNDIHVYNSTNLDSWVQRAGLDSGTNRDPFTLINSDGSVSVLWKDNGGQILVENSPDGYDWSASSFKVLEGGGGSGRSLRQGGVTIANDNTKYVCAPLDSFENSYAVKDIIWFAYNDSTECTNCGNQGNWSIALDYPNSFQQSNCDIGVTNSDEVIVVGAESNGDDIDVSLLSEGFASMYEVYAGTAAQYPQIFTYDDEAYITWVENDDLWFANSTYGNYSQWTTTKLVDSNVRTEVSPVYKTSDGFIVILYTDDDDNGTINYIFSTDDAVTWKDPRVFITQKQTTGANPYFMGTNRNLNHSSMSSDQIYIQYYKQSDNKNYVDVLSIQDYVVDTNILEAWFFDENISLVAHGFKGVNDVDIISSDMWTNGYDGSGIIVNSSLNAEAQVSSLSAELSPSNNNELLICFRIKHSVVDTGFTDGYISGGNSDSSILIDSYPSTPYLRARFDNSSGTSNAATISNSGFTVDTWYSVCGGYNETNNLLYLDGSLVATGSAITGSRPDASGYTFRIGEGYFNGGDVDGVMDEVIFFNDSSQSTVDFYENKEYKTPLQYTPTTPTSINCDDSTCNGVYNGTVIINVSGSTDVNGDEITYIIEISNSTADESFINTTELATDDSDGGSDTITASGENCGSECKEDAFDRSTSTKWLTFATAGSITVQLNKGSVRVHNYSICSANDAAERDPDDWTIEGSNDGSSWTVLDTVTNNGEFASRNTCYPFEMDTIGNYSYYKMDITELAGAPSANILQISEIYYYQQNGSPAVFEYFVIGNHTNGSTFSWDSTGYESTYQSIRSRAIDLAGSNSYSSYYTENNNFTIGTDASPVESPWCYQETANVSTACGGLSTGTYGETGAFTNGNWRDGNTATSNSNSDFSTIYAYVNYTIPTNATTQSVWQYVYDSSISYTNYTLSSCEFDTTLQFRITSTAFGTTTSLDCYDGASWTSLNSSVGSAIVREEGMWWYINNSQTPPSDTCTYTSGDWNVDCSDNCVINSAQDLGANNLIITGTGTFTANALITAANVATECFAAFVDLAVS